MANRPISQTKTAYGYTKCSWGDTAIDANAVALANGDAGNAVIAGIYPYQTFTAVGTAGAGFSFQWEGSNDGGTTWSLIDGPYTALPAVGVVCPPNGPFERIRPHVTAGDGTTAVKVYLLLLGSGRM